MNHHLVGELAARERLPEPLSFSLASNARDTDAEHAWHDVRHLARRERVANDIGDDIRGLHDASGPDGASRPDDVSDPPAMLVGEHGARLCAAAVDADAHRRPASASLV